MYYQNTIEEGNGIHKASTLSDQLNYTNILEISNFI